MSNKFEDFSIDPVRWDAAMLERLKESGWRILGAGFKKENTITARETNERLWAKAIPWFTIVAYVSFDEPDGYWLAEIDETK